jgi:hypothetical protein
MQDRWRRTFIGVILQVKRPSGQSLQANRSDPLWELAVIG